MEGRKPICQNGDDDGGMIKHMSASYGTQDRIEARQEHAGQDGRDDHEEGKMREQVDWLIAIKH